MRQSLLQFVVIGTKAVYGPDIIVNGGFDADTDWTKGNWTISGGTANISVPGSVSNISQNTGITLVGFVWEITFTVSNYVNGDVKVIPGGIQSGTSRSANGTYTQQINVTSGNTTFYIQANSTANLSVDNVIMRKVL